MKIELSPGEWAGVLNAVIERGELDDDREASDDYMRIAGLIREQIAEAGRTLPELPVPDEDQDEAECPHVWTPRRSGGCATSRRSSTRPGARAARRRLERDARTDYPRSGASCGPSWRSSSGSGTTGRCAGRRRAPSSATASSATARPSS
jgi:hypothetical protein